MTSEVVLESSVRRVFRIPCSCGAILVTKERAATCTECGVSLEVRRGHNRGKFPVVVDYHFECGFCGAPVVSTKKLAHCDRYGHSLQIVRAEKTRRRTRQYYPRKIFGSLWISLALGLMLVCYLLDLARC